MKAAYRVLAYLVAAGVVWQAASIAFAFFGLATWIEGGGVLDKAAIESRSTDFTGVAGLMAHGMAGMMIIPALALLLLLVSFFARVPGGVLWAMIVVVTVAVQVMVALFSNASPYLGIIHGATALLLFWVAWTAARRVSRATQPSPVASRERASASVS